MAMRRKPSQGNPLSGYAPAFDISNAMPSICKSAVVGLLEEHWPAWLREAAEDTGHDWFRSYAQADLHAALLLYIRAIKVMQADADVSTVDEAFAMTGFDKVNPVLRALVMARVMDYVNALFMYAIRDATVLVEGGIPVREDVRAAVDAVERMVNP